MADEGQAKAGKEWLTFLRDGMEDVLCRQKRMLLQQCSRAAPNWKEVLQPTTTRDLGEERRWGEKGWEGVRAGGDNHLRCGCARQVRRGGTEVTHSHTQSVSKSWTTVQSGVVRCSAAQSVQGTRAVCTFKTGNLGLPKRGAGDLRA